MSIVNLTSFMKCNTCMLFSHIMYIYLTCCAVLAMVYVNNTSYGFMCYIYMLYTKACNLPIVKTMCQILNTVITEAWCRVMFNESRHSRVSHRDRVVGPLSVDSFCQSDVNIHPVLPVVTCNVY